VCSDRCAIVLLHLKAIMSVCLKMLVIFLIWGEEWVKVAHFDRLQGAVGAEVEGSAWEMLGCILSLGQVNMYAGMLLLRAICNICCHSLCCCSVSSGRVSILLMRKL
jgi:hypothetical protein